MNTSPKTVEWLIFLYRKLNVRMPLTLKNLKKLMNIVPRQKQLERHQRILKKI